MNYLNRIFYRILLVVPGYTCVFGQLSAGDKWLIRELSAYARENVSLYSSFRNSGFPLLPADIPAEWRRTGESQQDQLIFHKGTVILAVDGTGRLYELHPEENDISFRRIDETIFAGYNFNAFVFSIKDSIFSAGGYGFWNFNGQLRYFNPSSASWNILPVNRKVPVTIQGTWLDHENRQLYFIESYKLPADEGLITTSEYQKGKNEQTEFLWRLNTVSRTWTRLGLLKRDLSGSRTILGTSKAGDLPIGELFTGNHKDHTKGLLINYASNKIYEFRLVEKHNVIRNLTNPEFTLKAPANRFVTFYSVNDSSFHILRSDSVHEKIKLSLQDFKELDQPVYQPAPEESAVDSYAWLLGTFAFAGMVFFIGGGVVLKKAREVRKAGVVNHSSPSTFTSSELQIFEKFNASPNHLATTDDLDKWLGNSNKTLDLRTKARSLFLRSINQKYSLVTGDPDGLIQAERMDSDRRMVRYRFDRKKFNKLMAGSGRSGN